MVRPVDVAGRVGPGDLALAVARPERDPQARRWGLLLVFGWLAQAGLRAWLSRMQTVPLSTPDEEAYLIAARVLAGGVPANFSYSTLYPAGYPLLIAPVYWFTHSPVTVYRAVLLINAPISAAVLPLAYLVGRRLRLDRPAAYGVATVAALLPAALFYSEFAMTDAIYPVLALGWLLCVHSWLTAQAFEVWWTRLEFFNPAKGPPPANATVVETEWLPGQPAQASWRQAPPGWRIVASDQAAGWVAWRR